MGGYIKGSIRGVVKGDFGSFDSRSFFNTAEVSDFSRFNRLFNDVVGCCVLLRAYVPKYSLRVV